MPSDLLKDLEALRTQSGNTYPELQHLELDGSNDVYPADVEAEANEWFQKVYHEKLNIEDFVSMLKDWQVCSHLIDSLYCCQSLHAWPKHCNLSHVFLSAMLCMLCSHLPPSFDNGLWV